MDRTAVARLARTLESAASSSMRVPTTWYGDLRSRIFEHLGEDPDLEVLLPANPPQAGTTQDLLHGPALLAAAAVYLREVAAQGPRPARTLAATDLMEQEQRLIEDPGVHVAAPIVLAGAALEEVLRDLAEVRDLTIPGRPSLNAYGQALRTAGTLTGSQAQEVTALAGTRNDAAHGRFDDLSTERAALFLERVNLLLGQLRAESDKD